MQEVQFTKEGAEYASECLDGITGAMPGALRDNTRSAANAIYRFLTLAQIAAPSETD